MPRPALHLLTLLSVALSRQASAQRALLEQATHSRVLANGLEVVVVENHGVPLATIEIDVRNGSFTQTPDYAGLAHMYEHMFFKGNASYRDGEAFIDRAAELGGVFNGRTQEESVNYYMTVPSDSLDGGMKLIAAALRNPLFLEGELAQEKEVVIGEYDRQEANPFFGLEQSMGQKLWPGNWSRKNVIGDRSVIKRVTPDQMREIQHRYYVPNNSLLVVTGDVDTARVYALAEQCYGDWPRSEDPFKTSPIPAIQALPGNDAVIVESPVGAVTVMIQWQGPSVRGDPAATYAADVFSDALNQPGSIFQQRLVDNGLFQSIGVNYYTLDNSGPITISGQTTAARLREALAALRREISHFDSVGYVSAVELAQVKAQRAINSAFGRERASGYAHTVGFWWSVADLDYYFRYVDEMASRTSADLAAYAHRYIVGHSHVSGVLISHADRSSLGLSEIELRDAIGPGSAPPLLAGTPRPAAGDGARSASRAAPHSRLTTAEGKAPKVARLAFDKETSRFTVDGIPVILRHIRSNEVISANIYLLGGVRQVDEDTEGIEPFMLDVSERGTLHYPRARLRRVMAGLGTAISVDPGVDWTAIGVRATTGTFDSTWAVMADRLTAARFDAADVALMRDQYLSAIRQRNDGPDALVAFLADSIAFGGSPYGRSLTGTDRSIGGMTAERLRSYAAREVVRSRMLVVVVGNITASHLDSLVRSKLGKLPVGDYHWTIPGLPPPISTSITTRARALPTNYILGFFHGPPATSPDYDALRLATSALSGQLFAEVRTRRNLSYAVSSPFLDRAVSGGGLYVTTTEPDSVLAIMHSDIMLMQANIVEREALDRLVQQFITEYFLDNETDADQANFLARAELYRGDYRAASRFVDDLRRVSPADIQRVAKTYMKDIGFAYVGDTTRVNKASVATF